MTIKNVLLGLLCLLPIHAFAQTNDLTNIRNAGAFSCGDVVTALSNSGNELEKTAFIQWTAGFSTAASRANSLTDVFPLIDTWSMMQMTVLVCRENIEQKYETALLTTIGRLKPYWVHDQPQILTLDDPSGQSIQLYVAAVAPLQQKLKDLGYDVSVDGVYGNQTGRALQQLGTQVGLVPLMMPDGNYWYVLTKP